MSIFSLFTQEALDAAAGRWPARGTGPSRDRPQSIQVLKNRFLDIVIGRARWYTPAIWFGPFIVAAAAFAAVGRLPVGASAALFASGWLIWSLTEYLLHRFLFHWKGEARLEDQLRHFLMHGYHHEFPTDPVRLVAPPFMSWGPGLLIGLLYWALLGPLWLPLYAGTTAGYIAYDWIHYYTHHAKPRGGIGKWLKRYHLLHHHGAEDDRYGVSSPLWDFVFGTYRAPKEGA